MGLDNAEGPSQAQAGVTGECRLENVTGAARWQELVAQWQGTTVSVLALPELAALSVCWGEDRAQTAIFREAETEDYSGFLAAFFRPEITKLPDFKTSPGFLMIASASPVSSDSLT